MGQFGHGYKYAIGMLNVGRIGIAAQVCDFFMKVLLYCLFVYDSSICFDVSQTQIRTGSSDFLIILLVALLIMMNSLPYIWFPIRRE